VRELRGMIERAVVVVEGRVVGIADLEGMPRRDAADSRDFIQGLGEATTLKDVEEAYIGHVFRKTGGSIKESSAILGIGRTTLWRKIRENRRLDSKERD
jgi:DNA-binding NtrC family response regulator